MRISKFNHLLRGGYNRLAIILLALLFVVSVTSCINIYPSADSEEGDDPSADTPVDIPEIPGAPAINTDQSFIESYVSPFADYLFQLRGENALALNGIGYEISLLYNFNDWLYDTYGTYDVDPSVDMYDISDNLSIGYKSDRSEYVFKFSGYEILVPPPEMKAVNMRAWGTGTLSNNPSSGNMQKHTMNMILEVEGHTYSIESDGIFLNDNHFVGTAKINGIMYDINIELA